MGIKELFKRLLYDGKTLVYSLLYFVVLLLLTAICASVENDDYNILGAYLYFLLAIVVGLIIGCIVSYKKDDVAAGICCCMCNFVFVFVLLLIFALGDSGTDHKLVSKGSHASNSTHSKTNQTLLVADFALNIKPSHPKAELAFYVAASTVIIASGLFIGFAFQKKKRENDDKYTRL